VGGGVVLRRGFTTLDPLEDTERASRAGPMDSWPLVSPRSIRLRILKDTFTGILRGCTNSFTTLDPLEDTESVSGIRGILLRIRFHHARSA